MINKQGWLLAWHLACFILVFTSFFIIHWGLTLIYIYKLVERDPSFHSWFLLIGHIDRARVILNDLNPLAYMAIGGAIIQIINGIWRWASRD